MTEKIPATPQVRRIQRAALALLVVSGAINTMDRAALAIANPLVRHDFGLSIAQMGALLSAFLWAYAFSQLPVGVLIDQFSTHYGAPGSPTIVAADLCSDRHP